MWFHCQGSQPRAARAAVHLGCQEQQQNTAIQPCSSRQVICRFLQSYSGGRSKRSGCRRRTTSVWNPASRCYACVAQTYHSQMAACWGAVEHTRWEGMLGQCVCSWYPGLCGSPRGVEILFILVVLPRASEGLVLSGYLLRSFVVHGVQQHTGHDCRGLSLPTQTDGLVPHRLWCSSMLYRRPTCLNDTLLADLLRQMPSQLRNSLDESGCFTSR